MTISDAMRQYIEKNGIKQTYIAQQSGIRPDRLCLILNNKCRLLVDEYLAICSSLKMPYDYFFPIKTKQEKPA